MDKQKIKRITTKSLTAVVALGLGVVGAYTITPSKKRVVSAPQSQVIPESQPVAETHFEKFVGKVTKEVTETGVDGLEATFNNFVISYKKDENSVSTNTIKIDGSLQFAMESISNLDFITSLEVDYNGKKLPLLAGFVDQTMYLGVKDIRIKGDHTSLDGLLDTFEEYFVSATGLDLDIKKVEEKLLGGLSLDNFDINELLNKFTKKPTEEDPTGVTLNQETVDIEGGHRFNLDVEIVTSKTNEATNEVTYPTNSIKLYIDVDDEYNLTKVNINELNFGTLNISGAIDMKVKKLDVLLPDYDYVANSEKEFNSPYFNNEYVYTDVVTFDGWIKKLANLLADDSQKLGLDFSIDMGIGSELANRNELGRIDGSINVDFSELIDLSEFKHDEGYWDDEEEEYEFVDDPYLARRNKKLREESEEKTLIEKVVDGLKLGVDLQIYGQNDTLYSNLSVNYEQGDGYLTFNKYDIDESHKDAVMKAKLASKDIKWLINDLPEMFKKETNDVNEETNSLFSFVTDSDFVKAVEKADFSYLISMLKTLRTTEGKIEIGLDLSSLGFDGSLVNLTLDSHMDNKVVALSTNDITIGDFAVALSLNTNEYKHVETLDKNVYQSLSFLPGVIEQVSSILDSKKAGFAIEGSVLDNNSHGLYIDGNGQFDYGNKYGYGDLDIKQVKYDSNSKESPWTTHKISLDARNDKEDKTQDFIKFVYGDINSSSNIKGYLTVQTILDIVDMIQTLIDEKDERFTKFIDPLMETLGMSAFSSTIKDGDYLRFAKSDLIKSVDFSEENIRLVIGGQLFGFAEGNDINIKINFVTKEEKQNIDSLEVNLVYGKEATSQKDILIKLSVKEFDDEQKSTIKTYDDSHANAKYMDFTSIKVLLDLGIRTTKLGYYNLDATLNLKASIISTGDISIGVHIVVDGERVKLYGKLTLPYLVRRLSRHAGLLSPSEITTEFSFETYPDNDPHKTNSVGGYFMIKKTVDYRIGKTDYVYYKSTSKNFIAGDNILKYVLTGMLDLGDSISNGIGDIDLGSDTGEKEPGNYTELLPEDGFTYNNNASNPEWNIVVMLGKALNIDALKEANVKINGKNGYLSSLKATLDIQASILPITVKLNANLINPNPNVTTFPAGEVTNGFNELHKASLAVKVINQLDKVDSPFETKTRIR